MFLESIFSNSLSNERTVSQKSATIALTLSVVRRFYEAALSKGLVKENPAAQIKPPKEKLDPAERVTYLQEEELKQLLAVIPHDGSRKSLRDRALLGIAATKAQNFPLGFGFSVRSCQNFISLAIAFGSALEQQD